jgi:hypothetical protein
MPWWHADAGKVVWRADPGFSRLRDGGDEGRLRYWHHQRGVAVREGRQEQNATCDDEHGQGLLTRRKPRKEIVVRLHEIPCPAHGYDEGKRSRAVNARAGKNLCHGGVVGLAPRS